MTKTKEMIENESYEILEKRTKISELEQFYVDATISNLPEIVEKRKEETVNKLQEFQEKENTIHIDKGAFGIAPKDMLSLKEELGDVNNIEILGVVTNMCVISNVVTFQSTFLNANIKVDGKLSASFDDILHNKALDVIESLQVKVER